MPRYHFHIEDGVAYRDEDGTELSGVETARRHAALVAAGHLRDHPCDVWGERTLTVTVQDHRGLTLFTVTVAGHDSAALSGSRPPATAGSPP